MDIHQTEDELAHELGGHLRDIRLRQNIDQRRLAQQAAVALNVIKNLESGKGATVSSLIKVLRALGQEAWLGTLAPKVSVSPMQLLKAKPARQRASPAKGPSHV